MEYSRPVDKLEVWDTPRIRRESATINGKTYAYIIAEPLGLFSGSILLIHGFPDLSAGWRYQLPLFLEAGFRVICPDCIGYGRSDAPSDSIIPYTFKSHADDFFILCKDRLGCKNIIVGGHDQGSSIAYSLALFHPDFVTHIFTLALPYIPPSPEFIPTEALAKKQPSLIYQLQLGSNDSPIEKYTNHSKDRIRRFLNAYFEGKKYDGTPAYTAQKGIDIDLLESDGVNPTELMSEDEVRFYVEEFSRRGLSGPCNWYRNRHQNFLDEKGLLESGEHCCISCPVLFIRASGDGSVTEEMIRPMKEKVRNLTIKEVEAGHWLHWEKPGEVNGILNEWMKSQNLIGENEYR